MQYTKTDKGQGWHLKHTIYTCKIAKNRHKQGKKCKYIVLIAPLIIDVVIIIIIMFL